MRLVSNIKNSTLATLLTSAFSLSYTPILLADSSQFTAAVKLYDEQSYQEAYRAFSVLVEQDYSSIDYSFYLAQAAAKLNKHKEAITAYERILILQPNHIRSKLELGKLYYQLQEYTLSKSYFSSAQNDRIPETVRLNISRYLEKIEKQSRLGSLNGALVFGLGYDTNVNSAPYASSWFVPVFGADFTNTTETVENAYHQEMALLNHYYDSTKKYGFGIKNSLLAYNKSIPGESDYNILYLRYKPSLVFSTKNYKIDAAIQFDTMYYGGKAYLENYGLTPNITHQINPSAQLSAHLKLFKKNYLRTEDQGRDANYVEGGVTYQKLLNNRTAWHIDTMLIQERKESGNLTDVSNDMFALKAGVNYQYSTGIRIGGELGAFQKNYLDDSVFFLNKRQDNNIKIALDVSKILDKDLSLQTRAERIQNSSNQAAYEYTKNVFLVNIVKNF